MSSTRQANHHCVHHVGNSAGDTPNRVIERHRFRFLPLDAGGPLTLQALQAGDISVALLFSTDPAITAEHLVVLADDRGLQPAENVVPLVRRDAVARYGPRLLAALDAVSARLSTGSLRALDAQVELRGDNPGSVAWTWLRAQGRGAAQ